MKSLNSIIQEKFELNKNTKKHKSYLIKEKPEIFQIVYDLSTGTAWEILNYCAASDNKNLKLLMKLYDESGVFKEQLDDKLISLDKYEWVIGVSNKDTHRRCVYLWSHEEISLNKIK